MGQPLDDRKEKGAIILDGKMVSAATEFRRWVATAMVLLAGVMDDRRCPFVAAVEGEALPSPALEKKTWPDGF
ncbi:hypothetical protein ACLOJK_019362 [Asimina triloba]